MHSLCVCVSCPIINLRVFRVLLFLFSTQCTGCGDSCYPSSSPSLFNVVLLNLWLCILKIEVAVHHTKSKPSKPEHQLSHTHTHNQNRYIDLTCRFGCGWPLLHALHVSQLHRALHCHLIDRCVEKNVAENILPNFIAIIIMRCMNELILTLM